MIESGFHKELTALAPEDSFLVVDKIKTDFNLPIHLHKEYELNLILNGKGLRRLVGNNVGEINNIELILLGPNLPHGWERHKSTSKEIREITIQFHNDLFDPKFLSRRIMRSIKTMFERSTQGILFSEEVAEEIKPRILKLPKKESIDYFLELISILQDLSNSKNQHQLSSYTFSEKNPNNSERMKVVYEFIHKNHKNKIFLNEVSTLVNMSPVSFNRFIKRRTGKTFIDYVNEIKVGYAAKYLVELDLGIAEIAYKSGFNNIAHFNRVFRKNKNCTPTKYREEFSGVKKVL